MGASGFENAAIALALGLLAQAAALRLAVPGIVLLLGVGALAGPDILGILDPGVFGSARVDLVNLAVTVILFEGGLALSREQLRQQQRSLLFLLTLGSAVSMVAGAFAARLLCGFSWEVAWLYGTLMIVTGPTVVTPLLARISIDRRVRELLISEGVLIDPVGASVAVVVAEYVIGRHAMWETGWRVALPLVTGAALGAAAGMLLGFVYRRRWVREEMRNPLTLAVVLVTAALANRLAAESGLMAPVAQGVVMANAGLPEIRKLREFKEELTVILLSFLFVMLAADLPLSAVTGLGWRGLATVAVLIWLARPAAVFLCTYGSELNVREKLFVSWICPRGIVAASVAGLFRILLTDAGIQGGVELEALVFVTVAVTVTLQGVTAGRVARLLGVDVPELRGVVIVGAHRFGRLLARVLERCGRQAVLVDRNARVARAARNEGYAVYEGDALQVEVLEDAGVRYADTLVAVTANVELNTLVAQVVRDNFPVTRLLPLRDASARSGAVPGHGVEDPFPGDFPGLDEIARELREGRGEVVEYEVEEGSGARGMSLADLPWGQKEFALLLVRRGRAFVATGSLRTEARDRIVSFRTGRAPSPLEEQARLVGRWPARKVAAGNEGPRVPS